MDSLLQQLENNEAILLMYLADELPAADRAEVEQMLNNDANLRAELASLRLIQGNFVQIMHTADAGQPLPISAQAASRQVMRLVNRWIGQRLAQEAASRPMALEIQSRRWWLYPMAAAAMLLLGIILWTGGHQAKPQLSHRDAWTPRGPWLHLNDGRYTENEFQETNEDVKVALGTVYEDEAANPPATAPSPAIAPATLAQLPAAAREDLQMLALVTGGADNETDPFIGAVPLNNSRH